MGSVFLLGYRTMACDFFPYTILSNKSVGTKDSLNAVFATYHPIVGISIGRNGSVIVINADSWSLISSLFILLLAVSFASANIDCFVVQVPPH